MPGFYEDELNSKDRSFIYSRAWQLTFHPVQADIHASAHVHANTHMRAHTHVRTRARAHTHTHTHFPACSLSLIAHYHACIVMQIKQRSETQMKVTLNSIIFTLLNQNLCGQ